MLRELRGDLGSQAWLSAAFRAGGILLGIWGGFRSRVRTGLVAIVGLGAATVVLGMTLSGFNARSQVVGYSYRQDPEEACHTPMPGAMP